MGTEGEERTVRYLIEQFTAAGLEPGGENGGWTQTVPLSRSTIRTSKPRRASTRTSASAARP
jgi:hypothetical protein